jgi:hypothetical protein
MALKKIDMGDGEFLYRCESCGFEHPLSPVKQHKLGPQPFHDCEESKEILLDDSEIHF